MRDHRIDLRLQHILALAGRMMPHTWVNYENGPLDNSKNT